ncbi:MAG: hypothetical protein ACFFCC_20105 [Promethearchaeota archaeon]
MNKRSKLYRISKTHASKLSRLMYEKSLNQSHDILASQDIGSEVYAKQLKKDFKAR